MLAGVIRLLVSMPVLLFLAFYVERLVATARNGGGSDQVWPQNEKRPAEIETWDPCIGSRRRAQGPRALPAFSLPT
jgi:hypothetical protein